MNIGILTLPFHINYGGILQAYALQTYLETLGHKVVFIRREYGIPEHPAYLKQLRRLVMRASCLLHISPWERKKAIMDYKAQRTLAFVDKYLKCSPSLYSTKDMKQWLENNDLEAVVVGSDQVWRKSLSPNIYNYFLDFIPNDYSLKRIAYSASFGVDQWEVSETQTRRLFTLLERFTSISVREKSGIDLVRKTFGLSAQQVLDPTLLIGAEEYKDNLDLSHVKKSAGNLFTYILDDNKKKKVIVREAAKVLDLIPFAVMPKDRKVTDIQKLSSDCIYPDVQFWLRAFMDAEFVVTDSFHGCVFSIIFNKPFVVIANRERGLARFESLLGLFHLEDRLCYDSCPKELFSKKIDWNFVNTIKKKLQQESTSFLKNSLEK